MLMLVLAGSLAKSTIVFQPLMLHVLIWFYVYVSEIAVLLHKYLRLVFYIEVN